MQQDGWARLSSRFGYRVWRKRRRLSLFFEDAVRARILELEAEQAKAENKDLPAAAIEDAVDEALEWARRA